MEGSQTPRYSHIPEYAYTYGDEAAELAATAGLYLDPWQKTCLNAALGCTADSKWAAFEVGLIVPRQNGKGSYLEALELAHLFLVDDSRLIMHSAHEFKTAAEHFLRVKTLIEGCDVLRARCKKPRTSHGEEQIETLDGKRLRFMARSQGSGRGFTGDLTVFDEAFRLDGKAMGAMLPTLSAVPNPQLQYTSSAPLIDSTQLVSVQARGRAGTSKRLAYFEWSAPEDALQDPGNRRYWAMSNPAFNIRIPETFIEAEQDALPAVEFARERLGISELELGATIIPLPTWKRLAIPDEDRETRRPGDPLVFAVDATPDRSWWSIAVAGAYDEGDRIQIEIVDSRPGQGWVMPRLVELVGKHTPARTMKGETGIVVDPGSAAGSLIPELEKHGWTPMRTTAQQVAQATGAFVDRALDDKLRHLDQPELVDALKGARQRDLADGWAWHRRNSTANITPLVAVTLAAWGVQVIQGQRMDVVSNVW